MKKKWKWIIAVIVVLLCFQACGSKPAQNEKPLSTLPTVAHTEATTAPEDTPRDMDFYCGTWDLTGMRIQGVDFTAEQVIAMGGGEFQDLRLVLCADNKAYMGTDSSYDTGIWVVTPTGIQAGNSVMNFDGTRLTAEANGQIIYFEKRSGDQTPLGSQQVPATMENTTQPETTEPATEATSEPVSPTGIRPEFKEAMDAYEAFYDEYCTFMEDYKKNPTDLSLLGKYAGMLAKVEEMDKKFDAWDESEMSNEELKYYLEVNTRVQKRMIDLF